MRLYLFRKYVFKPKPNIVNICMKAQQQQY